MLLIVNKKKFVLKLCVLLAGVLVIIVLIKFLSDYISQVSDHHDFSQIVNHAFEVRNTATVHNDTKADEQLYATNTVYGTWAYQYEARRIAYLHKWADKQGIEFTDVRSKIDITRTDKTDTGYAFKFINSTEYQYKYKNDSEHTNLFRIVTYHYQALTEKDGKWLIMNEWCLDPFEYSLNDDVIGSESVKNCILSEKSRDFSEINEYRIQAVEYADRYCGASGDEQYGVMYNKKYKNYNGIGGDCTNFISQVLHEGGKFKKTSDWNYDKEGSSAWAQARSFLDYMLYSGRASSLSYGTYDQVLKASYQLEPGDLISYVRGGKVEHTAIVTGADAKGYALVNCHTVDSFRVPWDLGWNSKDVKFYLLKVHY